MFHTEEGMAAKVRVLAKAVVALWAAIAAQAQADTGLKALATGDQSRGWEAVGRLNLGEDGFCTATLIAPDVVLTAAHCLYDKANGKRFPIAKMQFLADWRMGRAAAYRGVKRAVMSPDYVYSSQDKLARISHDIALLQLDQPIRLPSIQPFEIGERAEPGEAVGVVSYAQDRAEAPSLQQTCHVMGERPGFFVLSCDIDFGSSGAPVFEIRDGVARIVSVISAKADADGHQVALGVDAVGQVAALEARLENVQNGTVEQASGNAQPQVLRLGGGAGGAKFIKP